MEVLVWVASAPVGLRGPQSEYCLQVAILADLLFLRGMPEDSTFWEGKPGLWAEELGDPAGLRIELQQGLVQT